MKRNLKDGEKIDFEENLLIKSLVQKNDLLKQMKALFENFDSKNIFTDKQNLKKKCRQGTVPILFIEFKF